MVDFEKIGINAANRVFDSLTDAQKAALVPRTANNRRFDLECDLLDWAEAQARQVQKEQPGTFKINALLGMLSSQEYQQYELTFLKTFIRLLDLYRADQRNLRQRQQRETIKAVAKLARAG